MKFLSFCNFLFFSKYISHIEVESPPPRRSVYSQYYKEIDDIDYDNKNPVSSPINQKSICKGKRGPNTEEYSAGDTIVFKLTGTDIHNGGHCEWSLSFDEKTFISIYTLLGKCLKDQNSKVYKIKLPENLPSGNYVIAWTWINKSGNREFYINCIDIKIKQKSKRNDLYLEGPEMFIGNLKGYPIIPEFTNDNIGREYYDNRDIVRIYKPMNNDIITSPTKTSIDSFPRKPIMTVTHQYNNSKLSTKTSITYKKTTQIKTAIPTTLNNLCVYGQSKCEGDHLVVCFGHMWAKYNCFFNKKCKKISNNEATC